MVGVFRDGREIDRSSVIPTPKIFYGFTRFLSTCQLEIRGPPLKKRLSIYFLSRKHNYNANQSQPHTEAKIETKWCEFSKISSIWFVKILY